jgi:hypothetical protein
MTTIARLPTPFESLAGICKFIAVQKMSPNFYTKHWNAVEFASAFLRLFASNYPPVEVSLRKALPLSLMEGAESIKEAVHSLGLPIEKVEWLDRQMTQVLKTLLPVVQDPELPEWLSECRWAIEGAFNGS